MTSEDTQIDEKKKNNTRRIPETNKDIWGSEEMYKRKRSLSGGTEINVGNYLS